MRDEIEVAIMGAIVALVTWTARSLWDWFQDKRRVRAEQVARLLALESLLKASVAIFESQRAQVNKLEAMLKANEQHAELRAEGGFEDLMSRCYPKMSPSERELHGIVRAYTEHSMRKVNQDLSDWCASDKVFKAGLVPLKVRSELAAEIFALEIHLTLWHAKYASWIPGHPEHALVYMEDEKSHGLGFPRARQVRRRGEVAQMRGIEKEVEEALQELKG